MPTVPTGPDSAAAHARILADSRLQFDFPRTPPALQPPTPVHSAALDLSSISPFARDVLWIAGTIILAVILYRTVLAVRGRRRNGDEPAAEPSSPALDSVIPPERLQALLAQADGLAAAGHYDDAVHTLLLQGLEDIRTTHPRLLRPAYTSRDIARLDALPAPLRHVYGRIAEVVERSLFAGRSIDAAAYAACRQLYAGLSAVS